MLTQRHFGRSSPRRRRCFGAPKRGVSPRTSLRWLHQLKTKKAKIKLTRDLCWRFLSMEGGSYTGWFPKWHGARVVHSMTLRRSSLVPYGILGADIGKKGSVRKRGCTTCQSNAQEGSERQGVLMVHIGDQGRHDWSPSLAC